MLRVYVTGFVRNRANGAKEHFAAGVYNVDDELADEMLEAGAAFEVDDEDRPIYPIEPEPDITEPGVALVYTEPEPDRHEPADPYDEMIVENLED